jgi:hypothetical protein
MADETQNRNSESARQDEFDRALNATLGKYTGREPRAGLEDRVLANLRAEAEPAPDRAWWRWGLAVALAAILAALGLSMKSSKPAPSLTSSHLSPTTKLPEEPGTRAASNEKRSVVHALGPRPGGKIRAQVSHPEVAAAAPPKLDRFPSPQPLSEQEMALARYVSQFPQEATLVARVQEEYDKQIQQQMKDTRTEGEFSDSDPQER